MFFFRGFRMTDIKVTDFKRIDVKMANEYEYENEYEN